MARQARRRCRLVERTRTSRPLSGARACAGRLCSPVMMRESCPVPTDDRQLFQLRLDVLAHPHQLEALQQLMGEAMCGAPEDHDGPCRIAWSASFSAVEANDDMPGVVITEKDALAIREDLEAIPVWPRKDVDQSLGISDDRSH